MEMILNRHNIKNTGQEDIAYQLGLVVPEEDRYMFVKNRIEDMPIAGYGTQIQEEKYSINNFFKQNSIPLKEEYHFITDIKETRKFLEVNNENDILIIFHCGTLYNKQDADWGHMVLFDNIKNNNVTILEPSSKRNYETFPIEK